MMTKQETTQMTRYEDEMNDEGTFVIYAVGCFRSFFPDNLGHYTTKDLAQRKRDYLIQTYPDSYTYQNTYVEEILVLGK